MIIPSKPLAFLSLVLVAASGCSPQGQVLESWEHARSGIYGAAFSDDGRFVAVSTVAEGTGLWDLSRNQVLYRWRHGEQDQQVILHMDFSPDAGHVISADKRSYVVWDTTTGKALGYWTVGADITAVAISNKGRYVLLGLEDGRALHIDQKTRRRLEVIAHRNEPVNSVDLSAGGRLAVTGGNDHRTMVWDAKTGKEISAFEHGARVTLVALDPKARQVFSADNRGGAFVWDLKSGKQRARLGLKARQYTISAARFSPDGTRLLTGAPGRSVTLWDTRTGSTLDRWRVPTAGGWPPKGAIVYAVAFAGDGRSILAEASNGHGRRWALR
jgi:WD40 repeat protein